MKKEDFFRQVCREELQDLPKTGLKCHYLHHFQPYLKLGPFKLEELWAEPYRVKIHNFLSDFEINHLVNQSKPYLSKVRHKQPKMAKKEQNVDTVVKSVQYWTNDIIFREDVTYDLNEGIEGYKAYQALPIKDFYSYDIHDLILFKISQRIQLATRTSVISRFSSSRYQVKSTISISFC